MQIVLLNFTNEETKSTVTLKISQKNLCFRPLALILLIGYYSDFLFSFLMQNLLILPKNLLEETFSLQIKKVHRSQPDFPPPLLTEKNSRLEP